MPTARWYHRRVMHTDSTTEEAMEDFDLMVLREEFAWRRSLPTKHQLRTMFGVRTAHSGRRSTLSKEDVIERVDMVSLYEMLHPELPPPRRRSGRYIQAKCWRHKDQLPSLSLDLEKKRTKCFSCGERASAVDCVMDTEGMDFYGALRWLNDRF